MKFLMLFLQLKNDFLPLNKILDIMLNELFINLIFTKCFANAKKIEFS
jgi:hypothetical protein